jgi:hypothetical protein
MGRTAWALLAVNLVTLLAVIFLAGALRRSDRSITLLRDELADLGHRLGRAGAGDSVPLGDASGLEPAGACRLCGRTDEQPQPGLPAPYLIGSPARPPDRSEPTLPLAGSGSTRQVTSVTIGEPLIKVAAFSFGVRRALTEEKRALIAYRVRRELKRRRGLRRGEPRRVA